mmetsp:Transcript_2399/g.6659  ORF Transcript_2399/g.6659 Transcript_2399/m.6659 type:complete len:101 (-) Transcript_2399:1373-1675(-)
MVFFTSLREDAHLLTCTSTAIILGLVLLLLPLFLHVCADCQLSAVSFQLFTPIAFVLLLGSGARLKVLTAQGEWHCTEIHRSDQPCNGPRQNLGPRSVDD